MPKYTYTAIAKDGTKESASIEAASSLAAGHLLKEQGLMPISVNEEKTGGLKVLLESLTSVPLKEKIVFIEDLQIMMKSGIAAPRALHILAKQTKNRKFKHILEDIASSVETGKSLNEAMSKFPKVFSHLFTSMVKVGEISGNLEKALEYLAIQLEREANLKSKTKGAMIYPAVIVSAMVVIGLLMAIFVLPKLTSIFKEFNTTLPLATRIIIHISDFMSSHAIIVIVGFIIVVSGAVYFLKTEFGKKFMSAALLWFPLINPVVKKINLARFARVLASLMGSGIAIVEGLQIASDSLGNIFYSKAVAECAEQVRIGKPITEVLEQKERLFPVIVVQMLKVGEETGSMESILAQLASHYEEEVDDTMRNLSSIIEPLLLLIIGGVVAVLALALIGPIYSISQNIN